MSKKRHEREHQEYIERAIEKKTECRAKKRKPRIPQSGRSVFDLQKILRSTKKQGLPHQKRSF